MHIYTCVFVLYCFALVMHSLCIITQHTGFASLGLYDKLNSLVVLVNMYNARVTVVLLIQSRLAAPVTKCQIH